MLTPSRFDLTPEDLAQPLPALKTASCVDADLQRLTAEICQLDPQLAEIAFALSFSTKSREERLAQIQDWAQA